MFASNSIRSTDDSNDASSCWNLWIDGCGGYRLLVGEAFQIGRGCADRNVDIPLVADVPSSAGTVRRTGDDYYWYPADADSSTHSGAGHWCNPKEPIAGLGSADLRLSKPSPLCNTAVMTLKPPHRFGDHVDAVLLVQDTCLVGPSADCHVRCRSLSSTLILLHRDGDWFAKQGFGAKSVAIPVGSTMKLGNSPSVKSASVTSTAHAEISMLLESVPAPDGCETDRSKNR
jgi:hypothetical protein